MPRQEVRGTFVAAGADDQVDIANRLAVEPILDGLRIDIFDRKLVVVDGGCDIAGRPEQLVAAALRESDVEPEALVAGGLGFRVVDGLTDAAG